MKIRKYRDYNPISVEELKNMSNDELEKLLSICWNEGKLRCETIGITDVLIRKKKDHYIVSWSDDNGDPKIYVEMNELIDNIGDGEWNYGLYKK